MGSEFTTCRSSPVISSFPYSRLFFLNPYRSPSLSSLLSIRHLRRDLFSSTFLTTVLPEPHLSGGMTELILLLFPNFSLHPPHPPPPLCITSRVPPFHPGVSWPSDSPLGPNPLRQRLGCEFNCCTPRIEPDQPTKRQNLSPPPPPPLLACHCPICFSFTLPPWLSSQVIKAYLSELAAASVRRLDGGMRSVINFSAR